MSKTIPFYIGGREVAGKGRSAPVFNPATGEQSGTVSLASTAEVYAAIAVAKKAFPAWASTPPLRRARIYLLRTREMNHLAARHIASKRRMRRRM